MSGVAHTLLFINARLPHGSYTARLPPQQREYSQSHLHYLSTHTYQWDAEGRVAKVDGGSTWTFTYNALGHRVGWGNAGGGEQHVFDPEGNWLGLGNAGGYTLVRFGQRHLLVYTPTETYFHHINNLGSTSMMTKHDGSPAEDMVFYPWGNVWLQSGNGGYNFAYLPYRDLNTNTDLTTARVVSPNLGRWFTPDPIGRQAVKLDDPQTWNMYGYVRDNPTTLTDPSGLDLFARLVKWVGEHVSTALAASMPQQTNVIRPLRPPPGAPHIEYSQSTGDTGVKIGSLTVLPLGTGYAGHGQGLYNPANEGVEENYADPKNSNAGPLPRGDYTIGPIGDHTVHNNSGDAITLHNSMRLTPVPGATDPVDRSGGYLFHQGNFQTMDSSQGCIVEPTNVLLTIGNSGINDLEVVH